MVTKIYESSSVPLSLDVSCKTSCPSPPSPLEEIRRRHFARSAHSVCSLQSHVQAQEAPPAGGVTFYNPAQFAQVRKQARCRRGVLSLVTCYRHNDPPPLFLLFFPRRVHRREPVTAPAVWAVSASTQWGNKHHLAEILCKQTCWMERYRGSK